MAPQVRPGGPGQRVSLAKYSEDKVAGLAEIKTKIKGEVLLEQKRFDPRTGLEVDSVILSSTVEMAEAEKADHIAAIASLDEFIADVIATPEA